MLARRAQHKLQEVKMRKRIIGNWKMNGTQSDLPMIAAIADMSAKYPSVDSGLCLPATLLGQAAHACPAFPLGAQDCHMQASGAHTGCISAAMIADIGGKMVIVGHSERRADQAETDADICGKASAAINAKLFPIVCVGETLEQRDAGQALQVVLAQVDGSLPEVIQQGALCLAYEPVWAIGTGRIPSIEDVAAMHAAIRERLIARYGEAGKTISILYGGSMNGDNAAALLSIPNVDGGLIGGASLTAEKFEPILAAANI
jgi:triosephosphate isomerase